jgi:hypothetical protein
MRRPSMTSWLPDRGPSAHWCGLAATVVALVAAGLTVGASAALDTAQVFDAPKGRVDNVRFERAPGDIITVQYDLVSDDPGAVFRVALKVSRDGGKTFDLEPRSLTGDVGNSIRPGQGKKIVWEAGRDVESVMFDQFRFNVVAVAGTLRPASKATLIVSSDPAGATVMVDGVGRGRTPVTLTDLAGGKHEVRLVRSGYLENKREVDLEPGQVTTVAVPLTAATEAAGAGQPATAQAGQPPKKSSPLKWVLPLAGGGAAVGIALAAKGGGSDPTPPPPVKTCGAAFNTAPPGAGLAGATVFAFTVVETCTTNAWTFGDGSSLQGSAVTHVFGGAGVFQVTMSATNQGGTTSSAQAITVKSMTGTWSGTIGISPSLVFTMQLSQSGSSITGTYTDQNGTGPVARSNISDARNVSLTIGQNQLTIDFSLKGSDDMNTLAGTVSNSYTGGVTMIRQ